MSSLALLLYGFGSGSELNGGRQLYFWSFVVAILLYGMGAGVTLHEGVERLTRPLSAANATRDGAVLAAGVVLAVGAIWAVARRLAVARAANMPLLTALRQPRNAVLLAIGTQSAGALAGQLFALAGIALAATGEYPRADAAASIAIGLALAAVAAAMAIEVKRVLGLPGGEAMRQGGRPPVVPLPLPAITAAPVDAPLETKSMPHGQSSPQQHGLKPPIKGKKGRGKHRR